MADGETYTRKSSPSHTGVKLGCKSALKDGWSLSGGFTPCRHLRSSSGREHTIV